MPKCKDKLTNSGELCDLHTHTHFSDGSLSPYELVELAISSGLGAIALTDHNTIGGIPDFLEAAEGRCITTIPGIEFSTDFEGRELHILALGFSSDAYGKINALVDELTERKRLAIEGLIEALVGAGYKLDSEKIHEGAQGIVNRAHIATELVRMGYAASRSDAFDRILYSGGPFYRSPKYIDTLECVDFVRSIGAVSVLAHPFLNIDEARIRALLGRLRGKLDAIEVLYSEYDEATTERSMLLAKEFSLLPSGGSDFHGKNKPDISLGRGKGNLEVPLCFAADMGLLGG